MKAALLFGARVTIAPGRMRVRFVVVALCSALATALACFGLAFVGEQAVVLQRAFLTGAHTDRIVRLSMGLVVAVPAMAVAIGTGRLASGVRDRRAAGLALLGMDRGSRAAGVAVEVGIPALVGSGVGFLGYLALSVTSSLPATVAAGWWAALGLPVMSALAGASSVLRGARPARLSPAPGVPLRVRWRLALLSIGAGLCLVAVLAPGATTTASALINPVIIGIVLLALGIVAVAPVLVAMLAKGLIAGSPSAGRLLLGRRLAAHPAGATRVVGALMIGVFLAVGARGVVAMFESVTAETTTAMREGDRAVVTTTTPAQQAAVRALASDPRVRTLSPAIPRVEVSSPEGFPVPALVGTCADLATLVGPVENCRDDVVQRAVHAFGASGTIVLGVDAHGRPAAGGARVVVSDVPPLVPTRDGADVTFSYLIPPRTPGLATVLAAAPQRVQTVVGKPGLLFSQWLPAALPEQIDISSEGNARDLVLDDAVRRLSAVLSGVVLLLALVGVAVGLLDRAVERRAELSTLRVIGVGGPRLARTQWWEGFVPAASGVLTAVAAGGLAGAAYLRAVVSDGDRFDTGPVLGGTGVIAIAGLTGAALIATLGVLAAHPRGPERAE